MTGRKHTAPSLGSPAVLDHHTRGVAYRLHTQPHVAAALQTDCVGDAPAARSSCRPHLAHRCRCPSPHCQHTSCAAAARSHEVVTRTADISCRLVRDRSHAAQQPCHTTTSSPRACSLLPAALRLTPHRTVLIRCSAACRTAPYHSTRGRTTTDTDCTHTAASFQHHSCVHHRAFILHPRPRPRSCPPLVCCWPLTVCRPACLSR